MLKISYSLQLQSWVICASVIVQFLSITPILKLCVLSPQLAHITSLDQEYHFNLSSLLLWLSRQTVAIYIYINVERSVKRLQLRLEIQRQNHILEPFGINSYQNTVATTVSLSLHCQRRYALAFNSLTLIFNLQCNKWINMTYMYKLTPTESRLTMNWKC